MVSRELLDRCRAGEPGAFEELVELTHRQVYTLAHRLVGDRHEAEDVAQDAYLRVYRSLGGFRGESRFETWMYRIVTNAAMRHLRRRGRFGDLAEEPELVVRAPAAEDDTERVAERDEIRRAMATLPDGQRAVAVLRDIYGFSIQEIAEYMGTSEGAVKVRLHRARRSLKELIYGHATRAHHEDVQGQLSEYVEKTHG